MSSALRHYQAFPQIVAKMIEVVESTGRLTEVLGMLLEFYQFQQKMILEQKRLLNYPLVVFSIFIVLSLGAVISWCRCLSACTQVSARTCFG